MKYAPTLLPAGYALCALALALMLALTACGGNGTSGSESDDPATEGTTGEALPDKPPSTKNGNLVQGPLQAVEGGGTELVLEGEDGPMYISVDGEASIQLEAMAADGSLTGQEEGLAPEDILAHQDEVWAVVCQGAWQDDVFQAANVILRIREG